MSSSGTTGNTGPALSYLSTFVKPIKVNLILEYRMLADRDGDNGGHRSDGQLRSYR